MASFSLKDQLAIVTGGSRGIGYGIALELAKRGANVVVTYTSPSSEPKVEKLVAAIKGFYNTSSCTPVKADLRDPAAPDAIISATQEAHPGKKISILVNNAGCEMAKAIGDTTSEDYSYVYDLNVRAPLLMVKAVLPHFQSSGRIINVASVGARKGFPKMGLYCSSKAALESLTRCWAAELGSDGTTVNCINPGPTETDMVQGIDPDLVAMQKKSTPIQNRMGSLDDIAQIAAWLSEEGSRWVTGQCISASGGLEMY